MGEDFNPLSFFMGIEIVSKVLQVRNINIVLPKIPTIEFEIARLLLDHF